MLYTPVQAEAEYQSEIDAAADRMKEKRLDTGSSLIFQILPVCCSGTCEVYFIIHYGIVTQEFFDKCICANYQRGS